MNFFKCSIFPFIWVLILTIIVRAQPKSVNDLPQEIQEYLAIHFPDYSFSDSLKKAPHLGVLKHDFLSFPEQSSYYLSADFNGDNQKDHLLQLYKIENLKNQNSRYKRGYELLSVFILSKGDSLSHYHNISYSRGVLKEEFPTSDNIYVTIPAGNYEVLKNEYQKEEISILYPSLAIIETNGVSMIYWDGSNFIERGVSSWY